MRRFPLPVALALALPAAPALSQGFPPQCIVERQCEGETCSEHPGYTLAFEPVPGGLAVWDVDEPHERVTLSTLPGDGPASWVGRAPEGFSSILLTLTGPDRAVLTHHSTQTADPILTVWLSCALVQPPLSKRGPA
jgi:hypothetical protein